MCGRTACTRDPDDICQACIYKDNQGRWQQPVWRDAPGGQKYYPSPNIAPTAHTPVLISSQHYKEELDDVAERVVQPMKWGLVPPWHQGDPYRIEYETNNCRAEGMLQKRTYKVPLQKGQRCVVLAEGFFEWKRDKTGKQPYFIYFPQSTYLKKEEVKSEEVKQEIDETDSKDQTVHVKSENVQEVDVKNENNNQAVKSEPCVNQKLKAEPKWEDDVTDVKTKKPAECLENDHSQNDWKGPHLLTMAGVFDVWRPKDGGAPIYSYSIITVDASPAMSWIHDRMPAILVSDEEVEQWINFEQVPLEKAIKLIRPTEHIQMHPVSVIVNNSRNKSPDCLKPIDLSKPAVSKSGQLMMNWLSQTKQSKNEESSPKKKKI